MILRCSKCSRDNRVPAEKLDLHPRCAECKTPFAGTPLGVHSSADFDELVRSSPFPVVVDFWAAWCGPCKAVAPELERLAKQREGTLIIAKVNTDEVPDLSARFQIRSIPTFVLFSNGRETKRTSGAMPGPQIAASLGV
jgi:thioredoxin 2